MAPTAKLRNEMGAVAPLARANKTRNVLSPFVMGQRAVVI